MKQSSQSSINRKKRKALIQERRINSSSPSTTQKSSIQNTPFSSQTKGKGKTTTPQRTDLDFTGLQCYRSPLSNITNVSPTTKMQRTTSVTLKENVLNFQQTTTTESSSLNSGIQGVSTKGKGKRTTQTTRFNINNIPRLNLEINDDLLEDSYAKRFGISTCYNDEGDSIYKCNKCNAMLWEAEMLRGNAGGKKKVYGFCCKTGAVQLPPYPYPPTILANLFKSESPAAINFMNNIRAYNMMFSFTSMGGKVNQGPLNGRGPYVFRLQGVVYAILKS